VSLRMLTNLRLADLRLATAQQRSTGQNLPADLYPMLPRFAAVFVVYTFSFLALKLDRPLLLDKHSCPRDHLSPEYWGGGGLLEWGETESPWYVSHHLAYCTSPG
jgi:hypothetical protein